LGHTGFALRGDGRPTGAGRQARLAAAALQCGAVTVAEAQRAA
jgi:hypothetical protein